MTNQLGTPRRRWAIALGATALVGAGGLSAPAVAATVTNVTATTYAQLVSDLNYTGTGVENVVIGADIVQTIPIGTSGQAMPGPIESNLSNVVIDLQGHRVSITTQDGSAALTVGSGSTLSITDTSTGGGGLLIANATNTADSGRHCGAGIQTTGGTLSIGGLATVSATGANNCPGGGSAGIGGSGDNADGGTVNIGGSANVTAIASDGVASSAGAGIGGGWSGKGANVTITGSPTINTIGHVTSGQTASIGGGMNQYGGDTGGGSLTEPVPAVTSISPATGSGAGGAQVTISGTGFLGPQFVTAVSVGGQALPASAYTVQNGTTITATLPAHAGGVVPVTVATAGGTSNATTFTYTGPAAGNPTSGGTQATPKVQPTRKPTVAGSYVVGHVVTVKVYRFVTTSVHIRVQWYLNGRAIRGAHGRKLRVLRAYRGKRVTVRVTVTRSGYRTYQVTMGGRRVR